MTTPATNKIVIVAGQEFLLGADVDNEAIREYLKGNGFPDVAAATIQTGKKTLDGVEYQTVEFVKKAGTKGLGGVELAELLATVKPAPLRLSNQLSRSQEVLIKRLLSGQLSVGEALASEKDLIQALDQAGNPYPRQTEEVLLCAQLDRVPAVACAQPVSW